MSLPEPKPGLVIRYSYLWSHEHALGREEGVKDRPCAVLLATRTEAGDLRVIVLPITHVPPRDPGSAVEIPPPTKRRLGLDDDQSWIVLSEGNIFTWPGPDLRFARNGGPASVALGYLPAGLFTLIRDRFLALHERNKARFVRRTE
ncbi:hypothetical protein [Taklimakanibacter lacteus]|uniref:hypothetical protein n=1 Tax=Taklimakanibacter lacteus TaxID=2268456 RepID=UPI000E6694D5